ncbi:hypothetical protein [Chryseobacterium aquaticum]|uniref:hypothetical protein n=1 Tax=Chryseobacterium aquaticum TaxID=452084 RepID=UPI003F719D9C
MKLKILILTLVLLVCFFVLKIFLSDFFINKHEVHIMDKYFVVEINGEYNLMHKEEHGYSLIVPSVINVYVKQKDIIAISGLDGNKFINYKNKYSTSEDEYYYDVKEYKVQEVSEKEFLKRKETYRLAWSLK